MSSEEDEQLSYLRSEEEKQIDIVTLEKEQVDIVTLYKKKVGIVEAEKRRSGNFKQEERCRCRNRYRRQMESRDWENVDETVQTQIRKVKQIREEFDKEINYFEVFHKKFIHWRLQKTQYSAKTESDI